MPRKRSVEAAPPAEAPRAQTAREEVAALQQRAGNRAAAALRAQSPSAALLRGRVGNAGLARLLDPAAPSLGDLQSVAATAVNELAIAHDLLRAIDQSVQTSELEHGKGRKVNFPLVDHVLTGLSPSQLQLVFTEYRKESNRDLRDDLLGGSGPFRAELNDAQRARAAALLAGTALESAGALAKTGGVTIVAAGAPDAGVAGLIPSGLGYDDAAKVIARNRAFADAAELALLLEDGKPESVTQIMRILRKSAAANDMIAAAYERQFDKKLEAALAKLGGLAYERALNLRYGSWDRADALAIESVRESVARFNRAAMFAPGAAMMDPRKFAESGASSWPGSRRCSRRSPPRPPPSTGAPPPPRRARPSRRTSRRCSRSAFRTGTSRARRSPTCSRTVSRPRTWPSSRGCGAATRSRRPRPGSAAPMPATRST